MRDIFHVLRDPDPNAGGGASGGDPNAGGQGGQQGGQGDQGAAAAAAAAAGSGQGSNQGGGWQDQFPTDLKNSPLLKKFPNTPEGLVKAFESHASLEKLMGNQRLVVPKDANDKEGWAAFHKAMGVPDKPEGYKFTEVKYPESMKGMGVDQAKFAQTVHQMGLTPHQADSLWKVYNQAQIQAYGDHLNQLQANLDKNINILKQEWGDKYQSNVEMGQYVINKFAANEDEANFLTATLTKDPAGIRFLAKLGTQFAENNISGFEAARFSKSPQDAKNEIDRILADKNHPYSNPKATQAEHDAAVEYVNSLYGVINRAKG